MSTSQAGNGTRPLRRQTNMAVLKGNLAAKPELRYAGQTPVTTLRIANSEIIDSNQHTNFIQATLFGKAATDAVQYLAQGREVTVIGKLRQRSYWDKNSPAAQKLGEAIKRTVVEIVARECEWGFDPSRRNSADSGSVVNEVEDVPEGDPAPPVNPAPAQPEPAPEGPTPEQVAAAQAVLAQAQPQPAMQPQAALQTDQPVEPSATPDVPVESPNGEKPIPF